MTELPTIRVLLVDDHQVVRQSIRHALAAAGGFDVVGEAGDGEQALRQVAALQPDVTVMDVSMPNKDGIETTAEIATSSSTTKVLILTLFSDQQHALYALRRGASGFLCKTAGLDELIRAIREVYAGRRYLPPDIENALAEEIASARPTTRPGESLSKRELQVLCFLSTGLTNHEIARELGISVKTVNTHRGHVLKKLGLRNNADVTRFAIRNGYTRP